jgi:hypothetical protein
MALPRLPPRPRLAVSRASPLSPSVCSYALLNCLIPEICCSSVLVEAVD